LLYQLFKKAGHTVGLLTVKIAVDVYRNTKATHITQIRLPAAHENAQHYRLAGRRYPLNNEH
jgi:hypothetical protein